MAFSQSNAPSNLNMNNVIGAMNQLQGFAKSCRFAVKIEPIGRVANSRLKVNDFIYMCDSAELPGRGFDVTEVRYYGPSQAFPNNTMYNTANFSFLCRQASPERQYFDDWMEIINPTNSFNFEYADNYYAQITIFQFGEWSSKDPAQNGSTSSKNVNPMAQALPFTETQEQNLRQQERAGNVRAAPMNATAPDVIYSWRLNKAWPTLVAPQAVTWADNDVLRLQVTFAYKYWDRPTLQTS